MISIKQLLQGYGPDSFNERRVEISTRLLGLLLEGVRARQEPNWGITPEFTLSAKKLLSRIEAENAPEDDLLELVCEALELFETYRKQADDFFHEQRRQMQSIVVMLTETIADISVQSDASAATLQTIERQIQEALTLDDIRGLKTSLERCVASFKEAAMQQRIDTQATVKRLHEQVRMSRPLDERLSPSGSPETAETVAGVDAEYAISFKLRRADHIRSRFGDGAIEQMVALVEAELKPAQRPKDRMMRWKRSSLLMFVSSAEGLRSLRQRFHALSWGSAGSI